MRRIGVLLVLAITILLTACAPAAPSRPAGDAPSAPSAPPAPAAPSRTAIFVVRSEPGVLTPKLRVGFTLSATKRLFNGYLAIQDEKEQWHPYLAEALPRLNTDTWRVFPDGRMETTYKLRPNLSWHDGTPFSAEDFVFAWRVYSSPGPLPLVTATPQNAMEEVVAQDDRTLLIRWKRPFPDAGELGITFPPLPRHVLSSTFDERDAQPEALSNHPYWHTEYVHVGPYRLDRWELGTAFEGVAFDRHALGRPKIDRIRVLFVEDPNTAIANLLSGGAHMLLEHTNFRFQQGMVLKGQWTAGNVLLEPSGGRLTQIQFRPEMVNPRAILDLRVRRALFHAVDRQALSDGLMEGQAVIMDSPISRTARYYDQLDRASTKYPYDLRRTEQLMGEAGFTKGADGFYQGAEGRFLFDIWAPAGGQDEQELTIMAAGWRAVGIDASPRPIPTAQIQQGEIRASFPAFLNSIGAGSGSEDAFRSGLSTEAIPRPENRWTGSNRGGYSNLELDRWADLFESTLDRSERDRQVIEMAKLVSELLPIYTLTYDFNVRAHDVNLEGPVLGNGTWNIHEWRWKA